MPRLFAAYYTRTAAPIASFFRFSSIKPILLTKSLPILSSTVRSLVAHSRTSDD